MAWLAAVVIFGPNLLNGTLCILRGREKAFSTITAGSNETINMPPIRDIYASRKRLNRFASRLFYIVLRMIDFYPSYAFVVLPFGKISLANHYMG